MAVFLAEALGKDVINAREDGGRAGRIFLLA